MSKHQTLLISHVYPLPVFNPGSHFLEYQSRSKVTKVVAVVRNLFLLLVYVTYFLQVNEGVRSQENTDRLEWLQTHVNLESIGEVGILDFVTTFL